MAVYTDQSARRFRPYSLVMSPGERRRLAFYTAPWGGSTPSAPVLSVYDADGINVTATNTDDTYSVNGDSESEVVGSAIIWTRYIENLVADEKYSYEVAFVMGGNTFAAYGEIVCQEFENRLTRVKEDALWQGSAEKIRYQLDTRPWRLDADFVTALSLTNTVSNPVLTVFDLSGNDVTATVTTDESGAYPTEVSDYWVRTKFVTSLSPQEYRYTIKFDLHRNTYEAWGSLYGEGL